MVEPTNEVRIGVLGEIVEGPETGRWLEVFEDASGARGGFFIITYADANRSPDVYDEWVEDRGDLERIFTERGWKLRWPERP